MPSVGQMVQNGGNYLMDGHLMPPERLLIDVSPALAVFSLVTNVVATELTLMHTSTPVHMGVRAAAGSWKHSHSSSVDGWSVARHPHSHPIIISRTSSLELFTTRHSLKPLLSCNFQTIGKDRTLQPSSPSLIRDHAHLRFFTL